jgi:hypothetical protein
MVKGKRRIGFFAWRPLLLGPATGLTITSFGILGSLRSRTAPSVGAAGVKEFWCHSQPNLGFKVFFQ